MNQGKICVSVGAPDVESLVRMIQPDKQLIDVAEVRLDAMDRPEVEHCMQRINLPLLFTNRPAWEGGAFSGEEKKRLQPLLQAVRLQAAYVDLELRADRSMRQRLLAEKQNSATRLILSWHDFSKTPSAGELAALVLEMQAADADIGKLVTTAHCAGDVQRVLALLQQAGEMDFPLIAFCMGQAGKISRFATVFLGGYMTYVASSAGAVTASGQFAADHFYQLYTMFTDEH